MGRFKWVDVYQYLYLICRYLSRNNYAYFESEFVYVCKNEKRLEDSLQHPFNTLISTEHSRISKPWEFCKHT